MAALDALTSYHIATNKAVQDLAHAIAAARGIKLDKPQPDQPQRRGRLRYGRITRHGPGDLTAEVVNDASGEVRRFRILHADDGGLDIAEI